MGRNWALVSRAPVSPHPGTLTGDHLPCATPLAHESASEPRAWLALTSFSLSAHQ